MPERVLLLGDDLRAFLAIARSLGRRGIEVHAAPSDFSSPALCSRYIAAVHRLPPHPLDPFAWESALARLIAQRDFRLVVPTSDSGLFMLRHHAKALGRERIGIAGEPALDIFSDKANTRALAEAHGVPVAKGMLIKRDDSAAAVAAKLGLPPVLKPRTSHALGDVKTKRSAHRIRFEDVVRRIAERAGKRPLRLTVIGRDNVCRSPFAERLLRLRLGGLPVEIASAGILPRRGLPAPAAAVAAAAELGVDLEGHRSNALSLKQLERSDALVLLDEDAEWRLRQMCPTFTAELVTLTGLGASGTAAFPAIAAALARLASVVEQSFRSTSPPAADRGEADPVRRQAA